MRDAGQSIDELLPRQGRLFVVSGPSGVGKDVVLAAAFAGPDAPEGVARCVTATTRSPRVTEVEGRDYYFVSRSVFEDRVAAGCFLEHAVYNGEYYGTPLDSQARERSLGRDVVLKIEVKGALQVKARVPDAILIFLAPPSWGELERRLIARETDRAGDVVRRLAIAREELAAAPKYDYLVINDRIENAVRSLHAIFRAERCRIVVQPGERSPGDRAPAHAVRTATDPTCSPTLPAAR